MFFPGYVPCVAMQLFFPPCILTRLKNFPLCVAVNPSKDQEGFVMTQQTAFKDTWKANQKNLKLYVPVVARVHGQHHPEFHQVREQFDQMVEQIKLAGRKQPQLEAQFTALRAITDNYTVPGDVCESYEAVYEMLKQLDQAYHA